MLYALCVQCTNEPEKKKLLWRNDHNAVNEWGFWVRGVYTARFVALMFAIFAEVEILHPANHSRELHSTQMKKKPYEWMEWMQINGITLYENA